MTTQQKSALVHTMLAILKGHGVLSIHSWYAYCQELFRNDIVLFCELVDMLARAGFIYPDLINENVARYSLTDEFKTEELVSEGIEESAISNLDD